MYTRYSHNYCNECSGTPPIPFRRIIKCDLKQEFFTGVVAQILDDGDGVHRTATNIPFLSGESLWIEESLTRIRHISPFWPQFAIFAKEYNEHFWFKKWKWIPTTQQWVGIRIHWNRWENSCTIDELYDYLSKILHLPRLGTLENKRTMVVSDWPNLSASEAFPELGLTFRELLENATLHVSFWAYIKWSFCRINESKRLPFYFPTSPQAISESLTGGSKKSVSIKEFLDLCSYTSSSVPRISTHSEVWSTYEESPRVVKTYEELRNLIKACSQIQGLEELWRWEKEKGAIAIPGFRSAMRLNLKLRSLWFLRLPVSASERDRVVNSSLSEKDFEAFLLHRRGPAIRRVSYKIHNAEWAEDIVQQVMANIYEKYRLKPLHELEALFTQMLENAIIDFFRRKKSRKTINESELGGWDDEMEESPLDKTWGWSEVDNPEVILRRNRLLQMLENTDLSESQREAFIRHTLLDEGIETIARDFRVSVWTVKTHLMRARTKLRKILDPAELRESL